MKKLSHYDSKGRASMVDVSAKADTKRTATAHAFVRIKPSVLKKLPQNPKGDPLEVARIAGIMAAKRTPDLILIARSIDSSCHSSSIAGRNKPVSLANRPRDSDRSTPC